MALCVQRCSASSLHRVRARHAAKAILPASSSTSSRQDVVARAAPTQESVVFEHQVRVLRYPDGCERRMIYPETSSGAVEEIAPLFEEDDASWASDLVRHVWRGT